MIDVGWVSQCVVWHNVCMAVRSFVRYHGFELRVSDPFLLLKGLADDSYVHLLTPHLHVHGCVARTVGMIYIIQHIVCASFVHLHTRTRMHRRSCMRWTLVTRVCFILLCC